MTASASGPNRSRCGSVRRDRSGRSTGRSVPDGPARTRGGGPGRRTDPLLSAEREVDMGDGASRPAFWHTPTWVTVQVGRHRSPIHRPFSTTAQGLAPRCIPTPGHPIPQGALRNEDSSRLRRPGHAAMSAGTSHPGGEIGLSNVVSFASGVTRRNLPRPEMQDAVHQEDDADAEDHSGQRVGR